MEVAASAVLGVVAGIDTLVAAGRLGLILTLAVAQLLGRFSERLLTEELDGKVVRRCRAVASKEELRDRRKFQARLRHAA